MSSSVPTPWQESFLAFFRCDGTISTGHRTVYMVFTSVRWISGLKWYSSVGCFLLDGFWWFFHQRGVNDTASFENHDQRSRHLQRFQELLCGKTRPLDKLVSMPTDGAPAMIGRHSGFIAHCKNDPDFPAFLNYHCIIHQQAICSKVMCFNHVMTPVVWIINSIRSKSKQHRCFKLFLDELSAEYGDVLFHTEVRWLRRGRVLHRFIFLLSDLKAFMETRGGDTNLLSDAGWLLDLTS